MAIFASSGAGVFETIELAAPIDEHRLYISSQPHLYPLARALDQYPRYAVLVADTHFARIFVVAANTVEATEQVAGTKTRRHKMGGWSQARYQRHIENYHQQHAKEVVDTLARIVRDERSARSSSPAIRSGCRSSPTSCPRTSPPASSTSSSSMHTSAEREIVDATIETMRQNDAETDRDRVDELLGAYRANGLAVVGVDQTLRALELGQIDELVIAATPDAIDPGPRDDDAQGRTVAGRAHRRRTDSESTSDSRHHPLHRGSCPAGGSRWRGRLPQVQALMSKRINVNPDHYKVAGRERQGHAVAKAPKDQGDDEKARERWAAKPAKIREPHA